MARVYQKARRDCFEPAMEAADTYTSYRSSLPSPGPGCGPTCQSPDRKGEVHCWPATGLPAKLPAFDSLSRLHVRNLAPALRALLVAATLLLMGTPAPAEEPPPRGLPREIAANGSRFEEEFQKYTYRQRFFFSELSEKGGTAGIYREVRDILFTPGGERTEELVKRPVNTLKRMRLTEENFRDIREVQPFVLTKDNSWNYQFTYKGRETLGETSCYVYRMKPKQVLDGQRMLDGLIWVSVEGHQLVRVMGKPLPQIYRDGTENLFPDFTTVYAPVDGEFWFPVKTVADDVLAFSSGVRPVKYTIDYENYKRFSVESTITFDKEAP